MHTKYYRRSFPAKDVYIQHMCVATIMRERKVLFIGAYDDHWVSGSALKWEAQSEAVFSEGGSRRARELRAVGRARAWLCSDSDLIRHPLILS